MTSATRAARRSTRSLSTVLGAVLLLLSGTVAGAASAPPTLGELVDAGRIAEASARLGELGRGRDDQALRVRVLVARQDFAAAAGASARLASRPAPTPQEREAIYAWLVARNDFAAIDRRTKPAQAAAAAQPVDLRAAGQLALSLNDFPRAAGLYQRALDAARTPADRAGALRGLAEAAYGRRDFDAALKDVQQSLEAQDSAIAQDVYADTLVRLGRASEATAAAQEAVRMNPFDGRAHYLLGNGYARRNYTALQHDEPEAYARAAALTRSGSDAFERGDIDAARDFAVRALAACPDDGRAHNLLAKALEAQRLAIDVHHAASERRFAAAPMPEIPDIERFVLNWSELSPRHRKRVALSIEPWKAFVPVLVAGGETLYIKPLYMRLSETPGLQQMKDTRISYDSRLWDDVRGAGGFNTVTGIEDVEATISDRYNTVLHELSHQVHGVLGVDDWRAIESLYRRAKERDAASGDGFLSRYAGGSIWEYFAEGANSQMTPRRDAYDPREIVRERLERIDPALQAFEIGLMARRDVSASLPISLVNGAQQALGEGQIDEAVARERRALAVAPDEELVLAAALDIESVQGDAAAVATLLERALRLHPDSARSRIAAANARWRTGTPLATVVADLGGGIDRLGSEDRLHVEQLLGDLQQQRGDVVDALRAYDAVLAAQADDPEGLAGKAATLALAGRRDEAFALYEQVVRIRSGEIDVRLAYARDLLLAGRQDAARTQLAAARTLDAAAPDYLAEEAWLALESGDADAALRQSDAALAIGPWCDLAVATRAAALRLRGDAAQADAVIAPLRQRLAHETAPETARRADKPAPLLVHRLPAAERRAIERVSALGAGAR